MKHSWFWHRGGILPALLLSSTTVPAFSQDSPKFALCNNSECQQSSYYVGFNRTNSVTLNGQEVKLPQQADTILVNTPDLATKNGLPNVDERSLDQEDGNFVSSIHRIDRAQVGVLRKSELMNVHTKLPGSAITASVKLFWGDTFTVTSSTLAKGTPVTVVIERAIGGFGNPVTDNAFYQASFTTLVNRQTVNDLTFKLQKNPGQGQKDQISGKDKVTHTLQAKVGDTFTVESLMEVVDGVKVDTNLHQTLNGADAVRHSMTLTPAQHNTVCLLSASGKMNAGKC